MKKIFAKVSNKLMGLLPALARVIAVSSVSSTCFYMSHQPDVPADLQKLEK